MKKNKYLLRTGWDRAIFGVDTYEIKSVSDEILDSIGKLKGHFTVKIDPLSPNKKLLHRRGFYYCNTLIEPYCSIEMFKYHTFPDKKFWISRKIPLKKLTGISHAAFSYDRFHRDFNIGRVLADLRYDRWLEKLYKANNVFALMIDDTCAGFFACKRSKIVLHAVDKKYRGKGMAKYLWSVACRELFKKGHKEITSSISASNLAAVNLYSSLGFKFRRPVEVYHKLI